jgi:hypothetical protein
VVFFHKNDKMFVANMGKEVDQINKYLEPNMCQIFCLSNPGVSATDFDSGMLILIVLSKPVLPHGIILRRSATRNEKSRSRPNVCRRIDVAPIMYKARISHTEKNEWWASAEKPFYHILFKTIVTRDR